MKFALSLKKFLALEEATFLRMTSRESSRGLSIFEDLISLTRENWRDGRMDGQMKWEKRNL
jgi:hypothetical protein